MARKGKGLSALSTTEKKQDKLSEEAKNLRHGAYEKRGEEYLASKYDKRTLDASESNEVIDKIQMHDDISDRFQRLGSHQKNQLYLNIKKNGFTDPLEYTNWKGVYYLIDGHNRFEIYQQHKSELEGKRPLLKEVTGFDSWEEVIAHAEEKQFFRRNLKFSEEAYFFGRKYQEIKDSQLGKAEKDNAANIIHEKYNVNVSTLKKWNQIYQGLEPLMQNPHTNEVAKDVLVRGFKEVKSADIKGFRKKTYLLDKLQNDIKNQAELSEFISGINKKKKSDISPIESDYKSTIKFNASKFKKDPKSAITETIDKLNELLKKYE